MKRQLNILLYMAGLLAIMSSCKKKEEQQFTDTPIIESYLETGRPVSVKISRQIPFSSGVTYSADDINALNVTVTNSSGTYALSPAGDGTYTDSSIMFSEGDKFTLSFRFNEKDVSAYTYIPTKPQNIAQSATTYTITRVDSASGPPSGGFTMPDPLSITWTNTDNSYYLLVVENMESTLDPIRDFGSNAPPGNRFRKTPTTGSGTEIRAIDFQYYGSHRIIIYHVLPDYATLYESNSTSSQNLKNPSTSITNGYGIFTGLNSDTIFVEVKEP